MWMGDARAMWNASFYFLSHHHRPRAPPSLFRDLTYTIFWSKVSKFINVVFSSEESSQSNVKTRKPFGSTRRGREFGSGSRSLYLRSGELYIFFHFQISVPVSSSVLRLQELSHRTSLRGLWHQKLITTPYVYILHPIISLHCFFSTQIFRGLVNCLN